MTRFRKITVLIIVLAIALAGLGRLYAADVSTAIHTSVVTFANSSSDKDDIQAAFNISGAALIDDLFMSADALNAILLKGVAEIPGMPPTARIQVEGAVTQDAAVFTDVTSEAQSAATEDVPLLPGAAAVDDALYFGCDNPCRITTWDIDTAGAGTWTLTWEYHSATDSSFTGFANVDDRTSGFTTSGVRTASWDMPIDWATGTVTGSATNSFWGRARVSAFTSETVQPVGARIRYENGQWWTWVEDLNTDVQEQYILYLGGPADLVTNHQIFPGTAGLITADNATMETTGSYAMAFDARFDFSQAGSSTFVANKTGVFTITVSGSAVAPAIGTSITGASGTSSGDVTGMTIPGTGEQRVIVAADGFNAATWVNAGGGMLSYPVRAVTDNGNNWTWGNNGGVDYIEAIRLDADTPTIFDFSTTFADFDSGTQTNTQAYTGRLGLDNQ